jgi:heptosyltransferase I
MKVLVVRLSSMGDVVQTLPAIEDASRAIPDISFDWAVEEDFADIPAWHPRVERVIPVSFRRWKRERSAAIRGGEAGTLTRALREARYDAIVDLQGEMKSALVARLAKGRRVGYDSRSVHEWGAQAAYHRRIRVAKGQHSIKRMRQLMSEALGYSIDGLRVEYGIDHSRLPQPSIDLPERFLVFVHTTSWTSKNWPERNWHDLVEMAVSAGFQVVLPWGTQAERERAERISSGRVIVLPDLSIAQKAAIIARAEAVVGLDTGLSHIAAALGVPGISLYGATDPRLVGATGRNQVNMASSFECVFCHETRCSYGGSEPVEPACFVGVRPVEVWQKLEELLTLPISLR